MNAPRDNLPAAIPDERAASAAAGPRCLSIDLEVGKNDGRIHQFAAVRGNDGQAMLHAHGDLPRALARLDDFAAGCAFLLGHNLLAFDLPHLAAAKPDLRLLSLPAVDTLCLNPLAFPRNPYHHLVKHYQDGQLARGRLNDPELDARITLQLFDDQLHALRDTAQADPALLCAWHWLLTSADARSGLNSFFMTVRRQGRPSDAEGRAAIAACIEGRACTNHARAVLDDINADAWALAYALAWLSVAGENSVMPPWVRHQHPKAPALVRQLRDARCGDAACGWCAERHDPRRELKRWFGFDAFRPQPADAAGRPLQEAIVDAAMTGRHALGILPTGTGKSLCYQVPALSRYDKTGALTVVISPLVALMADQVANLQARGIVCCAAFNGLLSMPERAEVLERVRLGDVGILIVAPEQLRSKPLRRALAQREIGMWVLDEAHCISKWGHDFRPDYRYVGRFIREKAGDEAPPPVLCLTATAKPEVVQDIVDHFRAKLGIDLERFDGGASRDNLEFTVMPTTPASKFAQAHALLRDALPDGAAGGAIVYCSSRRQTEELSTYLVGKGMTAAHFHAGLQPETKKSVQQRFIAGELAVIVATNAFGMGIDKPDVRLVVHADMPGSLENYLQEAGRAGRDRAPARCVLLYTPEDVERQFGMSARSRLSQREIGAVLKALRLLARRKGGGDVAEVIATAGEILAEDHDGGFERDSATDDTRVRTAVSWLEEAQLLTREENRVQVFPSSLRIATLEEAEARLAKAKLFEDYRRALLALVRALLAADPDEGISTDELMGIAGLSADRVRAALYDLERLGIASNDTALTAFVHAGVARASMKRLEEAAALEAGLIGMLREAAPDLGKGESSVLHLRHATQRLKDAGHAAALPEKLSRLLGSLAQDGRDEDGGAGSLRLRRLDGESLRLTLQRDWQALEKTALLRRAAATRALEHLLACLPEGARGADLLAETTLGQLHAALAADVALCNEVKDTTRLLDRALLWLHEQEAIRLNKGLAVFRPAMTIRLLPERRGFTRTDFAPLKLHYHEQVLQIHVMAEYVERGLRAMKEALRLAMDYFRMDQEAFLAQWLPGRMKELERQTTPASWRAIVESLNNPAQARIVADDREQTSVLVLAGPGSGKTRVLVHRIAYLLRVRREQPHGILALAYNRHAAVEIRRRLDALVGADAKGVLVMTCHAFAMRLTGTSFRGQALHDEEAFRAVIRDAVALLKGEGVAPEEADLQRERLLGGFRWILVDEYQDIGPDQYELISALAGRSRGEDDGRLSLFAVGDDDQNIYGYAGASVEFIRRFEADYAARAAYLVENYRSSAHIIDCANRLIAPAAQRMKAAQPIAINRARAKLPAGGSWQERDPVAEGRVQLLSGASDAMGQAAQAMMELQRLAQRDPKWDWSRVAVIARNWKLLDPLRAYCELHRIPAQMANEEAAHFWQLRETRALAAWLRERGDALTDGAEMLAWLDARPAGPWCDLLQEAARQYALETVGEALPAAHAVEWLAEWGREVRRRQHGLLLTTAHRAKGLEFDHVAVLDGGWQRAEPHEDRDAPRRLLYVAMTRARHTLLLTAMGAPSALLRTLDDAPGMLRREAPMPSPLPAQLYRRHLRPGLKEIDIGFAGRRAENDATHRAIAALRAGDALTLRHAGERYELLDASGCVVGRMAQAFTAPAGMRCIAARVHALLVRRRDDADAAYQASLRCEEWELVLPELVFEPEFSG